MRIVFDLSAPKDVPFFKPMIENLLKKNCRVSIVARDYKELNLVITNFGLKANVFGRHGGESLLGKLKSFSERVILLSNYFYSIKPDALVTLSNPESTRAAFGLKIPVLCFNDIPEAEAVCRLALPLASKVFVPWIIPKKEILKYGVSSEKIFCYRALDPLLWLKDYELDRFYLDKLKIDSNLPLVVCRETEWQSAYVSNDLIGEVIQKVKGRHPEWQVINIPRYKTHQFYDTPSLLSSADLLIGGGGTMCIEAAFFGTPVISTRLLDCHYMNWLCKKGLAEKSATVLETIKKAEEIIIHKNTSIFKKKQRAKARKMFGKMEFPLDKITKLIMDTTKI